jgi:xanthine dehydrogenase small subunit
VIEFELDGVAVEVPATGSLLDALREHLGVTSAKDGCSPQGQCGCCTVWVDGHPRVACVTRVARVSRRSVTTVDGLPDAEQWATSFAATGASQCGFCTPGIIMRLAALDRTRLVSRDAVGKALLAHLCRCTGWQTIVEAAASMGRHLEDDQQAVPPAASTPSVRALHRAEIEGRTPQRVGPAVALGRGGFSDDLAPTDALVAVRRRDGTWAVGADLADARAQSGKVQGRRTTAPISWPLEFAEPTDSGGWARTLRTTWVEPAYLEPDAAWCEPGGEPHGPLGNGGAFGGKVDSEVASVARRLAAEHGRSVRTLWTREDVVRSGPKRPPVAICVAPDGTGVVRVARTPGIAEAIAAVAPDLRVEEVEVCGPPTSVAVRGAGWAEVAAVLSSLRDGNDDTVTSPDGAVATAHIDAHGSVHLTVECGIDPGDPDEVAVARSYCIGAAHMALGWVRSEALAVDEEGEPLDLTIRSFGVLRAVDVPEVTVEFTAGGADAPAVNGSDAVFAAVAAAGWRVAGFPPEWPTGRSASGRS